MLESHIFHISMLDVLSMIAYKTEYINHVKINLIVNTNITKVIL